MDFEPQTFLSLYFIHGLTARERGSEAPGTGLAQLLSWPRRQPSMEAQWRGVANQEGYWLRVEQRDGEWGGWSGSERVIEGRVQAENREDIGWGDLEAQTGLFPEYQDGSKASFLNTLQWTETFNRLC